ncbi:glucose-6-phosphate isomerase [Lysobacter korlensis]|uniref:Glucose-6-phosphate isomerase n=1 Tax=Lysobacter korlensis TaxID=553636 RepID=A0ABV6RQ98_9GAMM
MEAAQRIEHVRAEAARLGDSRIGSLLQADPARASQFALRVGPLYANFSRQRFDRSAIEAVFAALTAAGAEAALSALFDGVSVNVTESRPALHSALRSDLSSSEIARAAHAQAQDARNSMRRIVEQLHAGGISDVVSVGIGGSDLGPRLAVDALAEAGASPVRVHFLSNVDGHAAQRVLAGLDRSRTAVLLISKSFSTQETLLNGAILRDWLGDDSRLYAISANVERAAREFSIPADRILPMWDWVGGRYSLWSAVGLPIALAIGMDGFEQLLAGAAEMDAHVLRTPLSQNMAAWHAATAIWNRNGLGFGAHAVLPYDERLKLLPNYLQQLVMESLGKSVQIDGRPVAGDTVPVWWGGAGTDTQHSFFQALHQGTDVVPCDLIGVVGPAHLHANNHRALLSNLFAQAEAFANGQASDDPHRSYAGNRPSTMILLDSLTPHSLGALLALYEHSVYLQAVFWGINPFDQFGVELGKQLASTLLPVLEGRDEANDAVTRELIAQIRRQG